MQKLPLQSKSLLLEPVPLQHLAKSLKQSLLVSSTPQKAVQLKRQHENASMGLQQS
jgi:hypothetical protein